MEKTILDNFTLIIPINEFDKEKDTEFLKKATESISKNKDYQPKKIIVVHTADNFDKTLFSKLDNVQYLTNTADKKDFAYQLNLGAKAVDTEYFGFLEFDDELGDTYFRAFKEYSDFYKNISVFLPTIIDISETDVFIKFTNSEALSRGLIQEGELGLLSHDHIKPMTSLNTSGAIFKTEDFNGIGGFKSSIKLSFIYEFLLRASYNDQKIFVIPRFTYLHRNGRPGSYLDQINKQNITKEEVTFWFDTARKEFYFDRDRDVVYKLEVAG